MKILFKHPFFIRLRSWEYWNRSLIYAPVYPFWVWLSIKARSFFFLTAANPKIKNGGFIMESKKDIYDQLPDHLYPPTCHFDVRTDYDHVISSINSKHILFPVIAKPDYGEKGVAVKKIINEVELKDYVMRMPVPFMIQRYVDYENEVGIFYYRMPGSEKGNISGIVSKYPVAVKGDGLQTVRQLAKKNNRYVLQWKHIEKLNKEMLDQIPAGGETVVLFPYGNHCRGSLFIDDSIKITPGLEQTIDAISRQIPEFYYGRLDIKFKDWSCLESGKEFSVIEVNGSGSEPTHIYDPAHSIFFAWKEIVKHWRILYRISKANQRRGNAFISTRQGQADMKSFRNIYDQLSAQHW